MGASPPARSAATCAPKRPGIMRTARAWCWSRRPRPSSATSTRVGGPVKLLGLVNATEDFDRHPYVIDGCSVLLHDLWGEDGGHARSCDRGLVAAWRHHGRDRGDLQAHPLNAGRALSDGTRCGVTRGSHHRVYRRMQSRMRCWRFPRARRRFPFTGCCAKERPTYRGFMWSICDEYVGLPQTDRTLVCGLCPAGTLGYGDQARQSASD